MMVTGFPIISAGMVTFPPLPIYLLMYTSEVL